MIIKIILLSFFILALFIHEMGHVIHYLVNGLRIKCISLGKIVIVNDNKWSFHRVKGRCRFFVMPEISLDYTQEELRKIIRRNLLAGPIATLFVIVISFVCVMCNRCYWSSDYWLRIIFWGTFLINGSILSSCFKDTDLRKGDLITFWNTKGEEKLFDIYIIQYAVFSKTLNMDHFDNEIPFGELNDVEKEDYAFDMVTLFLLEVIKKIPYEIKEYVEQMCREMKSGELDLVHYNMRLFLNYEKRKNGTEPVPLPVIDEGNALEVLYRVLNIDRLIIERYSYYE